MADAKKPIVGRDKKGRAKSLKKPIYVDPNTDTTKPVVKMTSSEREAARKADIKKSAPGPKTKLRGEYQRPVLAVEDSSGTAQPVRAAKNSELRRGITSVSTKPKRKRRKKAAKPIAKPQPGQAGKLDGQVVRVTPENAEQVYEQRRRTELPAAEPETDSPSRPMPGTAIMPSRLGRSQNKKNYGGFAQSHKVVAKATHQALGHLNTMANTPKGSAEHHDAQEQFNVLHGQIGQIGNKKLHKDLGLGRTIVQQYHGTPNLAHALEVHKGIVIGRLEEGRIAEQARGERSGKKKEGQ